MRKIRTLEANFLKTTHRISLEFCKVVFQTIITDLQQQQKKRTIGVNFFSHLFFPLSPFNNMIIGITGYLKHGFILSSKQMVSFELL